jgi:hypothetical protein
MIKNAILVQRKNDKTDQTEWALVSKKDRKVLKWFGAKKPSDEAVQKEEKRIQYFKNQGERMDRIKKLAEEISLPEDVKLSIRENDLIKEAADPTKKTADSLFKIIQFLLYRFPENDKRKYLGRAKGKIVNLNPAELSGKKMSPSALIGQAVSLSKNLLSGLNPIFVGKVLEELIRMLSA